jgi:hypothetical protein
MKKETTYKGVQFSYKFKNLPLNNIKVNNQNVQITTFEELTNDNYKYKTWIDAFNQAKEDFKTHLVFVPDIEKSIEQYYNKVLKETASLSEKNRKTVERWKMEFPDTLYGNLKALNNYIVTIDNNPHIVNNNNDERCHCNINNENICEIFHYCGSNIRFFGVDCAGAGEEDRYKKKYKDKNTNFVASDRTILDCTGKKSEFWLHLRSKRVNCSDDLWFLALRIHFRQIESKKIEIGWIGGHLYIPCTQENYNRNRNNARCQKCPRKPDPNISEEDRYNKFLAEWE